MLDDLIEAFENLEVEFNLYRKTCQPTGDWTKNWAREDIFNEIINKTTSLKKLINELKDMEE